MRTHFQHAHTNLNDKDVGDKNEPQTDAKLNDELAVEMQNVHHRIMRERQFQLQNIQNKVNCQILYHPHKPLHMAENVPEMSVTEMSVKRSGVEDPPLQVKQKYTKTIGKLEPMQMS